MGYDYSGNGNHFTATNISVSAGYGNDSLEDTPTNNACVMNDVDLHNATITNGGLQMTQASDPCRARGTHGMPPNTGKYYYEMTVQAGDSYTFGLKGTLKLGSGTSGNEDRYTYYGHNGYKQDPSSSASYGATYTAGDTVSILYDSDSGEVYFYKNGASQGLAFTGINDTTYLPYVYLDNYGTTPIVHWNFGQRPFAYTPPTGAKGLGGKYNVTPVPAGVVRPERHFECLTYTGNGSNGHKITGLEFKPDLVWFKCRSESQNHDLYDSVRGGNKRLIPNGTDTESSYSNLIQSFDEDGVTLGTAQEMNKNSATYVAWCWKAGGAAVANTDGTLNSQVSVNEEAGFSIVSWTSTGTTGSTIGHGLGKKPDWILLKGRNTSEAQPWRVYHKYLGATQSLMLDSSNTAATQTGVWNDTEPTSSVFTVGSFGSTNENGKNYIAYCWNEVPGYSKFGSYTGNGSTDGTYVHLGFRPAWLIIRVLSNGFDWVLQDNKRSPTNLCDNKLNPDSSAAEQTDYDKLDMLSNGFKPRVSDAGVNANGSSYVYFAFAERPTGTFFGLDANAR